MKILLTGSSGFTGEHFQRAAANAGHEIVVFQSDLTDKTAVEAEVRSLNFDAVVNLAAISYVANPDKQAFYNVNTHGTENLLFALAMLPERPKKVLLVSSANVYGNCNLSSIGEKQPFAPVDDYAKSKVAMEEIAGTFQNRLPIIIARPFSYTGPGQSLNFVIPKLVAHYVNRCPEIELGNLYVEREFNDVHMLIDAYLGLTQHGIPGEAYNICSGRTYSLRYVMELLTELTGHTIKVKINPGFIRANEVNRLCGDPAKLQDLCDKSGFILKKSNLLDTLKSMLIETV